MNDTLNPLLKWLVNGASGFFSAGGALLAVSAPMDGKFWFLCVGGFFTGLVGKALTVAGDNAIQKKSREHPDER